jgi:acyl-CoA synthetase (AMP-forming)/AMP-acid ligase II
VTARVRFARSASAPLPVATLRAFTQRTGIGVLETYGMTEAASQIAANPIHPAARRAGSVGLPFGVEVAVLDGDGQHVATGDVGVVHLRGDGIVRSYLDISEDGVETARNARDARGWLCTGDAGRFDEDGFLHLAGRVDDVINRGGEKFYPAEIESVLLAHPGVAAATVVAGPHARLGNVPLAFVIPRARDGVAAVLASELQAACAAMLPRYKCPTEIRVVSSLPVGATGKVRRRELVAELAAA